MTCLMPDVREYEPHNALTDFKDGLTFYKCLSKIGHNILKKDGWIITEVGTGGHPSSVLSIFNHSSYLNTELIKDYNGDNRILIAQV